MEPGKHSLSAYESFEESNSLSLSLSASTSRRRWKESSSESISTSTRFPVRKSVSSCSSHLLSSVLFFSVLWSWHRFDELCGYPIIHNSLFLLCTQFTHAWFTASIRLWFVFILRFLGGYTLVHVGTRFDVFWCCGWWSSGYEHRDGLTRPWNKLWQISRNSFVLNSKRYSNCRWCWKISKQAQQREKMRYKLSCRTCWEAGTGVLQMLRWDLKSSLSTGHPDDTEHSSSLEHSPSGSTLTPKRLRGRTGLSSWRTWQQLRDTLHWAAQQDTPMSKLVPILSKSILKSTLHCQSLWKERHWILWRTRHEAQIWKRGGISWEGLIRRQSDEKGRCRVVLSILEQWKCMSCHEPFIEQWEERVRSYQSRAREKILKCDMESWLKCALKTSRHTFTPTSLVC